MFQNQLTECHISDAFILVSVVCLHTVDMLCLALFPMQHTAKLIEGEYLDTTISLPRELCKIAASRHHSMQTS